MKLAGEQGMKRRIMIVDDDEAILQWLCPLFRRMTCAYGVLSYELEIEMLATPKGALARARDLEFDAFLSDYRMPEMDGIEFLKRAGALRPDAVKLLSPAPAITLPSSGRWGSWAFSASSLSRGTMRRWSPPSPKRLPTATSCWSSAGGEYED